MFDIILATNDWGMLSRYFEMVKKSVFLRLNLQYFAIYHKTFTFLFIFLLMDLQILFLA